MLETTLRRGGEGGRGRSLIVVVSTVLSAIVGFECDCSCFCLCATFDYRVHCINGDYN